MNDETRRLHRQLGVQLFNRCWELIDRGGDRTGEEQVEMLLAATASRWHWGQVGGPEELATGDWQIAHVAAQLGLADVATLFAQRNLATAEQEGWDGWRRASAHEGMARAAAASGDAEGRALHEERARDALAREPDEDDRDLVASQLESVPEARS